MRHVSPRINEIHAWLGDAVAVTTVEAAACSHHFLLAVHDRPFFSFNGVKHGRLQMARVVRRRPACSQNAKTGEDLRSSTFDSVGMELM